MMLNQETLGCLREKQTKAARFNQHGVTDWVTTSDSLSWVSLSVARIAIFIGSNYGKKTETCRVGLYLEHQVRFCSVDTVASAEKVVRHPRGFLVFWGAHGVFLVCPAAGRRLCGWAWQGIGALWRSCACHLLAVAPSTEALTIFNSCLDRRKLCLSNGFVPLQTSLIFFGSNPC